ncbi:MAG: Multidrug resistance protein MdtA [Acidobacteria bacterium]|nr:Multidrug resistance protein MdtA [Acidobacteriota bacterium]
MVKCYLVLLLASLTALSSCSGTSASGKPARTTTIEAAPVAVATVSEETVPIEVRAIGNVEAYSTVSVKALIGGELTQVYFKEGQDVKKGEMLFTIDPRPLEAALKQAEANLDRDTAQMKQAQANVARDTAQAKNAEVESRRYAELMEAGVATREQADQSRTNAEALAATVRADQAAVASFEEAMRADNAAIANAKLQLGYCSISSPIDGRTGSLMVHQGNVVKANDVPLVTINQVNPIYVTFSVPEKELSEIRKYRAMGKLKVEAVIANDEQHPAEGALSFVDNTVDNTTGTIRLKATFDNKERKLWPGQFVNVSLTLTSQPNAVVAPTQAVQTGQSGQYVFVVKPDLTVEARPVVVGRALDGKTVIEQGLQPGEKVVIDGQLRLTPGAKVQMNSN